MPETILNSTNSTTPTLPSERVRATMCAARVGFIWFGTQKSLTAEQRAQAAEPFGATGAFLSAGKKLLDTKHPRYRAVTSLRSRVRSFWGAITLPYPEPGVRLIRRDTLDRFQDQMAVFKEELDEAVLQLDEQYSTLKTAAVNRLGSLFNEADYPTSLVGLFNLSWDFPSIEPPSYLQQLNPELYEQECNRMRGRFEEVVQMAEGAFIEELSRLVSHLCERLSAGEDGRPKVFRDTAVGNLQEFFDRFRLLNVRSNEQLDSLVSQCSDIIGGARPQELRDNGPLRQNVASQLSAVQSVLDGWLVDRPRRRVIRTS